MYESGANDFRRLQAASLRLSDDEVRSFHNGSREPNEELRRVLGRVLGREISRVSSGDGNDVQLLKHFKVVLEYMRTQRMCTPFITIFAENLMRQTTWNNW